jgi:hypothetical protein
MGMSSVFESRSRPSCCSLALGCSQIHACPLSGRAHASFLTGTVVDACASLQLLFCFPLFNCQGTWLSGYFAHLSQHKHYYIPQALCQAFISQWLLFSQKHWSLVTLDKTTYPGSFVFKKHKEPMFKFHALGKTILEDATLTWPKMPITL